MIADTTNGKGKMPAFKGKLTDAQIKDSVAVFPFPRQVTARAAEKQDEVKDQNQAGAVVGIKTSIAPVCVRWFLLLSRLRNQRL